ncbi:MAG: CotH kinase family protein [Fibrobacter sp.]|nr:CotH kinase family protein [Fibrobacter sp.]
MKSLLGDSFFSDDLKKYPYANLPRFLIKTENNAVVVDRETKVPATMILLDESKSVFVEKKLTIKGRGNSSWTSMPKKSYKLEFNNMESFFGFPKNRDWALIANYADKTLMRNYLVYNLSATLAMPYSPRCEFVEVFLNGEYLGVYLLTETVKVAKNRVNIPENEKSFLVEVDGKSREGEVNISSKMNKHFTIHSPKKPSERVLDLFIGHINEFEDYLKDDQQSKENIFDDWIDRDTYLAYYWIQEFSKNNDASFFTSVYFTWVDGGKIMMGPVWDFDLAFGNYTRQERQKPENFYIRNSYWNSYLFNDEGFASETKKYWENNRNVLLSVVDSIEPVKQRLKLAAANNFKKWNILNLTDGDVLIQRYNSYDDAVDDLYRWILERYDWINSNY